MDQACKTARDERRSAILKTAHEAFLAEGYAATSMSSIAARCGGSKATLYNYFPSKDGLFEAVVQDRCGGVTAVFDRELQQGSDLATCLKKFGMQFVTAVLSDINVATYRMIVAESARFPELGRMFYQSGPRRTAELLGAFFAKAVAEGNLKASEDPLVMARTFVQLCLSDLQMRRLFNVGPAPTSEEAEAHVARAVRIFLAAYGPDQDETKSVHGEGSVFTGS